MNDDFINYIDVDPKDLLVNGQVEVGSSATGVIDFEKDNDWFKAELKGGHTYVIDMEGSATDMGTLSDPIIRGIFDSSGQRVVWTFNDDGGEGYNARLTFTPEQSGLYFISAGSYGFPYGDMPTPYELGSYTVSVVDTTPEAIVYTLPDDTPEASEGGSSSSGSSSGGRSGSSSSSSSSTIDSSHPSHPDYVNTNLTDRIDDFLNAHPFYVDLQFDHTFDFNLIEGTNTGDITEGTNGADYINGGSGEDTLSGGRGNDFINGFGGDDTLNGGPGDDELVSGNGTNTLNGDSGNDILSGGGGMDTLNGGSGKDLLFGGSGGDTLNGGSGNDILSGESGSDRIIPGRGRDVMQGGAGYDVFVFGSNDGHNTILDFKADDYFGVRKDKIDISATGLTFDDIRIVASDPFGDDYHVSISFAGTTIILENPPFADLTESNFIV